MHRAIRSIKVRNYQQFSTFFVILAIAILGYKLLTSSHAQSPYVAVNASSGALTGNATKNVDPTAASGESIVFGSAPSTSSDYVTASGTNLMLGGKVWKAIGFDAYGMEGCWNGASGTAWNNAQLDAYFSGLPANGLTRIWAEQAYGTSLISNIVAQASKYNQHLVLSIGNDDGNCNPTSDDESQSGEPLSFYQGGWQSIYAPWVKTIVPMFANNPTVAMWEIANEPGQSAVIPESTMQSYMSGAAAAIKAVDPNQLIESGFNYAGNANNNTQGNLSDYEAVQNSPDIDVISFHDYSYDYENGAQLSGGFSNAQQASKDLNKPFIDGEAGVEACSNPSGSGPSGHPYFSYSQRASWFQTKANDYLTGVGPSGSGSPAASAIMFWVYEPESVGQCSDYDYDVGPGDPTLSMVQNYVVP